MKKLPQLKPERFFSNPERKLLPGQFVRIIIKGLKRPKVIIVPQKAVMQTLLGTAVYVVENEKAVFKTVKLGEKNRRVFYCGRGSKTWRTSNFRPTYEA